ncbi:MAG: Ig-like domain-containing protein [Treponema sp.]|nr:Ig-like domain-containing protein [Treponema sp.]
MKKVNLKKNLAAFLCAVGIVTAGGILGCSGGTNYTGTSSSSSSSSGSSSSGTGSFEKLTADRIATTASSSAGTITLSQSTSSDMILLDTTIGTYTSLQAALDAAAAGTGSFTITLTPGTYNATGLKYRSNNNLKIKGDSNTAYGTDVLIVGQGSDMAAESTRSLLSFEGTANIVLENLTLKNSYGMTEGTAQAETLGVSNNSFKGFLTCYNCSFLSGQDTICTEGKAWFYKCYIEGDVDFLWMETYDGKVALYEECVIRAIGTRTTSAYITAPRLSKNNSVWKGIVLYNSTLQAESGLKNFYLGRNPWAGSTAYYENVAIIGCKLYLGDGVTLADDVWKSAANGTSNQQYIGFKTDSYFPASSAGHGAILTADQIASEYAGRENILNRYYDTNSSKFKKDTESYWNVARTVSDNRLSVTADSSKSLLAGETEVKSTTYDILALAKARTGAASYSQNDSLTNGSSDDSVLTWSNIKYHSEGYGITTSSTSTITIAVTEPSVISWTSSTYSNGTLTVNDGSSNIVSGASTRTTTDKSSEGFLYTGTSAATLTLTFTGTTYINNIVVKTLTDEANAPSSVRVTLAASQIAKTESTTASATVSTIYMNTYTPSISWTSTDTGAATIDSTGAISGVDAGTTTIKATCGGVEGTAELTVTAAASTILGSVEWDMDGTDTLSLYSDAACTTSIGGTQINRTTGYVVGGSATNCPLYVDGGTSGKFSYSSGQYVQLNAGTKIYVPVSSGSTLTINMHSYNNTYQNVEVNGTVMTAQNCTYTANGDGYVLLDIKADSTYMIGISVTDVDYSTTRTTSGTVSVTAQ